jgi:hypothetical protein
MAKKFNTVYAQNFLYPIKDKLSPTIWENNVSGFYYATEAIVQWYTDFDRTNTVDFGTPVVNNMKYLSDILHPMGKKFLWIPYYRSDSNHVDDVRIGYVGNRSNIFDYIIIQPSYYFSEELTSGVNSVLNCVKLNTVVNANGEIIGGTKISNTVISAELEVDSNVTGAGYYNRYQVYVNAFYPYRKSSPFLFYAGDRNSTMTDSVYNKIKYFYSN